MEFIRKNQPRAVNFNDSESNANWIHFSSEFAWNFHCTGDFCCNWNVQSISKINKGPFRCYEWKLKHPPLQDRQLWTTTIADSNQLTINQIMELYRRGPLLSQLKISIRSDHKSSPIFNVENRNYATHWLLHANIADFERPQQPISTD